MNKVEQVKQQVANITISGDHPREGMRAAVELATFAVREMTGKRRRLALRLASALANYSALDADKWPDVVRSGGEND